jgi:Type II CAAX prenyl endopeptidase Rce1-like
MITLLQVPPPSPVPPLPRIGPGRAWGEVSGLFVVVFGADVINAARDGWATVAGAPPGWAAWWDHWAQAAGLAAFAAGMAWLISLRPWQHLRPRLVLAGLATITGLAAVATALALPAPAAAVPLSYLAQMMLAAALAGTLGRRRGLTLHGLGLGRGPGHGRRSAYARARTAGVLSLAGIMAASIAARIIGALPGARTAPDGFAVNGLHTVATMVIASIHAGVCEELLLTATVVTALEAARRPAWQIFAAGVGMRLAIHLYFGISAPAAMIFAATNIWLFRRTRRLMPLVAAHVFADASAPIAILGGPYAVPAILVAAGITDIAITQRAIPAPASQEPPP